MQGTYLPTYLPKPSWRVLGRASFVFVPESGWLYVYRERCTREACWDSTKEAIVKATSKATDRTRLRRRAL